MSFRRTLTALLSTTIIASAAWTYAQATRTGVRSAAVEDVLPAEDCILFWSYDGIAGKESDWEKTAFYDSMVASGFVESIESYVRGMLEAQGVKDSEIEKAIRDLVDHVIQYGGGIAVYPNSNNLENPPEMVAAIGNGEEFGEKFQKLLALDAAQGGSNEIEEDGDRYVFVIEDLELNAWFEDGVLLISGPSEFADAIAGRMQTSDSMAREHKLYPAVEGKLGRGFLDTAALLAKLDEGVGPHPRTGVRMTQIADDLGVAGLQGVSYAIGLNGAAIEGETTVSIDPENRGIFDDLFASKLTLDDLPSLPTNVTAFSFARCDLPKLYDNLMGRARTVAGRLGEIDDFEEGLADAEKELGMPLRNLVAGFGDVVGIYDQSDAGMLAPPIVIAVSVRDRDMVRDTYKSLIERTDGDRPEEVVVQFVEEDTYDRVTISTGTPVSVSLGVNDEWAVIGMTPSYFSGFFDRYDDKVVGWKPDAETLQRRPELSGEFLSVNYVDTATTWTTGLNAMPMLFGIVGNATGTPAPLPRLPRSRNITRPMFPNVSVTVETETGAQSRSSMSAFPLPTTTSGGALASPLMLGVGAALVLPAIQQARSAARNAQSKNNLKQLALAMHNYHSVYNHFPAGTVESSAEKPEDRLSWITELTPYMEMNAVHDALNREEAWNSDTNIEAALRANTMVLQNPNMVSVLSDEGLMSTAYVGCAGVGKDAAKLPVDNPKAGMFGYDRATRLRDITDGTSNSLMIGEVSGNAGAWTAGGKPTLREFTEKPYINGPDGFGGSFPGGSNFALGDGSVRMISDTVDPSVAEALMTISGGEVVDDF